VLPTAPAVISDVHFRHCKYNNDTLSSSVLTAIFQVNLG